MYSVPGVVDDTDFGWLCRTRLVHVLTDHFVEDNPLFGTGLADRHISNLLAGASASSERLRSGRKD